MFFLWAIVAIYHSLVTYMVPVFILGDSVHWVSGEASESTVTSCIIYSVLLATVCLKAGLETSAWTALTVLSIFGSFLLWTVSILLMGIFIPYISTSPLGGSYSYLFKNINIPFVLVLTIVIALGPDLLYKALARTLFATEFELGIKLFKRSDTKDGILSIAERHIKQSILASILGNRRKSRQAEELSGGFAYTNTDKQGVCGEEEYVRAYTLSRSKSTRSRKSCAKKDMIV